MISSDRPTLRHATVGDAMSPGVISCPPGSRVADVASIMATNRIHCVVVPELDGGHALRRWGVVSDAELMTAGVADFSALTARDIAASEPLAVNTWESLQRACQLLAEHRVAHLLVVDDGSWPVGVLSSLDIARVTASTAPAVHTPRQSL
jgi:CBS domain-containing protein